MGTPLVMMLAVRGALAVILGLATVGLLMLAVLAPRVTANVLVILFGTYVLVDGALTVVSTLRSAQRFDPWLRLQGVIGGGAGAAVLSGWVAIGAPLFYLIAVWAIVTGALEMVAARALRRQYGVWGLSVSGLASVLLGIAAVIGWPGGGLMAFMWLLAAYALLVGIARILAAVRSAGS